MRSALTTAAELFGLALISAGFAAIWLPLGLISAGIALILLGVTLA